MGCVNSNSVDNKDDPDKEKADKAKQRRRLSVAPHHVENKDQDQRERRKQVINLIMRIGLILN